MQKIDEIIKDFLNELDYEPILTMLAHTSSGKKLRSKLILSIAGESSQGLLLCAVVELIHLASLLHDDIVDESKLRRGVSSVNAEFGAKNALMLGDILYSKAFEKLVSLDQKIAKIIAAAVANLSVGELMDVRLSQSFNDNKNAYLKMIYNKTAVLIEASAKSAAILADLNELEFGEYGKNLGLAFQMIDDILDIKNDTQTLGKPALHDYKEGKTTLPYIYLYESLDLAEKDLLKALFKQELNSDQEAWLRAKFAQTKALQNAINEAKDYGLNALKALKNYKNEKLENIVKSMLDRDF